MTAKTTILDALEAGDTFLLDERPTIVFHGQTLYVSAYLGNKTGGVLVADAENRATDMNDTVRSCLVAAANLVVLNVDWTELTPEIAVAMLARQLGEVFSDVYDMHQATLAARGKPS